MCVCVCMHVYVCVCLSMCEVRVKSHKCFPWLLRHRKRGSGILCGNILWLQVVFGMNGRRDGGGGVSLKSHSFDWCRAEWVTP